MAIKYTKYKIYFKYIKQQQQQHILAIDNDIFAFYNNRFDDQNAVFGIYFGDQKVVLYTTVVSHYMVIQSTPSVFECWRFSLSNCRLFWLCVFGWICTSQSTPFQSCRDDFLSSWVEHVLSRGFGHFAVSHEQIYGIFVRRVFPIGSTKDTPMFRINSIFNYHYNHGQYIALVRLIRIIKLGTLIQFIYP